MSDVIMKSAVRWRSVACRRQNGKILLKKETEVNWESATQLRPTGQIFELLSATNSQHKSHLDNLYLLAADNADTAAAAGQ